MTHWRRSKEDFEAEIRAHIELEAEQLRAEGLSPAEAMAAARRRFGNVSVAQERFYEKRRPQFLDALAQDVRYAWRQLRHSPLFAAAVVLTLALGIGANAAVFGVAKDVLLDALPYADADRLVRVHARKQDGTADRMTLSAGAVVDITRRVRSFERIGVFMPFRQDVAIVDERGPQSLSALLAGPGFFQTLGVRAHVGRTLQDADAVPGAPPRVVLSYGAWQRLFASDLAAVGRTARIDGTTFTIVGVLPRSFVSPVGEIDVWFPLDLGPTLRDPVRARQRAWLGVVARLRQGVTPQAAAREVAALSADLGRQYPDADGLFTLTTVSMRDDMAGETRTPLVVLMASAALVLLITCANLAGALLSRTISRRREFALRVALGAGRGRLVRQLLTESTLLALAGGVAGIGIAVAGLTLLRKVGLPALPPYAELAIDNAAFLVTFVVALVAGAAFGLAPALTAGRIDPQRALREETRSSSEARHTRRLRGALVAGQIALCLSLLAGAGLLARSLWAMTAAPLGFAAEDVAIVDVQLPAGEYATAESRVRFHQQLEARLRALPGVRNVAIASQLPGAMLSRNGFVAEGEPMASRDARHFAYYAAVSTDYFRTLQIPLVQGRVFGAEDRTDSPPVVVVSEALARRHWPRGNAIGARMRMGPDPNAPWATIVGVVGDVRNGAAQPGVEPMLYVPMTQSPWEGQTFLLRTSADAATLVRPVQRELSAIDPGLPVNRVSTLDALLADGLSARRLPVVLVGGFAVLALLLASVGVYAMFASMTAAREREFGVRMALGSSRLAIATLVVRQGSSWMALGLAGGALGIVGVARLVRTMLYGIAPFDVVTLGVAVALLLACAAVALVGPVRRASRADPVVLLR